MAERRDYEWERRELERRAMDKEMRPECAGKFGGQEHQIKSLEEQCQEHDERISLLEKWQNRSIGYAVAIASLLAAAWQFFLRKAT